MIRGSSPQQDPFLPLRFPRAFRLPSRHLPSTKISDRGIFQAIPSGTRNDQAARTPPTPERRQLAISRSACASELGWARPRPSGGCRPTRCRSGRRRRVRVPAVVARRRLSHWSTAPSARRASGSSRCSCARSPGRSTGSTTAVQQPLPARDPREGRAQPHVSRADGPQRHPHSRVAYRHRPAAFRHHFPRTVDIDSALFWALAVIGEELPTSSIARCARGRTTSPCAPSSTTSRRCSMMDETRHIALARANCADVSQRLLGWQRLLQVAGARLGSFARSPATCSSRRRWSIETAGFDRPRVWRERALGESRAAGV